MTLKTIAGSRDTEEFRIVEQQIVHRANGASIFAADNDGPSARRTLDAPTP